MGVENLYRAAEAAGFAMAADELETSLVAPDTLAVERTFPSEKTARPGYIERAAALAEPLTQLTANGLSQFWSARSA